MRQFVHIFRKIWSCEISSSKLECFYQSFEKEVKNREFKSVAILERWKLQRKFPQWTKESDKWQANYGTVMSKGTAKDLKPRADSWLSFQLTRLIYIRLEKLSHFDVHIVQPKTEKLVVCIHY